MFLDYCKSQDVEHEIVIKTIVSGVFKNPIRTMQGTLAYFYNPKTTKEFAEEAFKKEFEKVLLGKTEMYSDILVGSGRRWFELELLVKYFLDSPNQDIVVVIGCLKQYCEENACELPEEANYLAMIVLRHPRCNFAAVKYFINYGSQNAKKIAFKHKFSKKLSAFY